MKTRLGIQKISFLGGVEGDVYKFGKLFSRTNGQQYRVLKHVVRLHTSHTLIIGEEKM